MRHALASTSFHCRLRPSSRSQQHCFKSALAAHHILSFYSPGQASRTAVSTLMSQDSASDDAERHHPDHNFDPEADAEPAGTSSKQSTQRAKKSLPKKRDTHFLCFPLVTDTSVPQLARSLQYFRDVSTKPSRRVNGRTDAEPNNQMHDGQTESTVRHGAQDLRADNSSELSNVNRSSVVPPSNGDFQLLPPIAHRPAGTFHLTLGVMDLSKQEEMDRAVRLLQELDYTELFRKILSDQGRAELQLDEADGRDYADQVGASLESLHRPISPPLKTSQHGQAEMQFSYDRPPKISLTGLSTFPSAKSSRVFFAKPLPAPSEPFPLLQFGQAIRRKFREAGFITETRPLVLHATVANMRYAVQARGGRTSKGRTWRYGKDRWKEGQVDARELIKCFDLHRGNVEEYVRGTNSAPEAARQFVWAEDIVVNRVAICKMGAEKSDDEILGQVYPPISERFIFPELSRP